MSDLPDSRAGSEPPPRPEPDADPFEPGPAGLQGCGKPAVIGCLVVLALAAGALILLVSQSQKLLVFAMGQMRSDFVAALPADLGEAERARLDAAFDGATRAVEEGRLDSSSLASLQAVAGAIPRRGETLSRERVEEITRRLEEMAAVQAPSPSPGASARGPAAGSGAILRSA